MDSVRVSLLVGLKVHRHAGICNGLAFWDGEFQHESLQKLSLSFFCPVLLLPCAIPPKSFPDAVC